MKRLDEYHIYHQQVVTECVELMGEDSREFYDKKCTYFDEFEQGVHPRQVAQEQLQAMRDLVSEAEQRKPESKPVQMSLDPNMPASISTNSKSRRRKFRVL